MRMGDSALANTFKQSEKRYKPGCAVIHRSDGMQACTVSLPISVRDSVHGALGVCKQACPASASADGSFAASIVSMPRLAWTCTQCRLDSRGTRFFAT
jgi:hypothetical protein